MANHSDISIPNVMNDYLNLDLDFEFPFYI